ncbi:hypothetical protein [Streptomyces sp. NBC_00354]|uniref:hypothetical protein n=1 Tax=Streptomyces sp. NBC_00354 TaxID=2975723 RepID=UPI002E262D20|nr:hypothetical protein OG296_24480 [Streptomyces sp. NBC_01001]
MPDWIQPVLAGAFLVVSYRVVRTSGAGLRVAVLLMAVLNAGVLWLLAATGPPWGVVAVALVSLVAAVHGLLAAMRTLMARIQRVDAEAFRGLVLQAANAPGPQVVGVCVMFSGSLALTAFADDAHPEGRQFHLVPGPDCPFCLVEDQIRDFLGPADPLLDAYRTHLQAGSSRHLLVKRRSEQEPWTGRLRDRVYYRIPAPARRPPCAVHDPLLGRP